MRSAKLFLTIIIAVFAFTGLAQSQPPKNTDIDQWFGVFKGSVKVGYEHISIGKSTFEGKSVYKRTGTRRDTLNATNGNWYYTDNFYISRDFSPIYEVLTCHDGSTFSGKVEARYNRSNISCTITINGKVTHKTIAIPHGTDLSTYCKYRLRVTSVPIGKTETMSTFLPDYKHPSLFKLKVQGVRRERVEFDDEQENALVIREHYKQPETIWRLSDGRISKIDIPARGEVLKAEDEWDAVSDESDSPVAKTDYTIPDPNYVTELKVRFVDIISYSVVPNDNRQTMIRHPSKSSVDFHITTRTFNPSKSIALPVTAPELADYLRDEPGIQVSDKRIKMQAKRIVKGETNAFKAARRIHRWVYDNIDGSDEFINNSAIDVLMERSGVCRHSAYLFTALARSVGIPTRVATGMVFGDDGFYAHAWVECFVGEWVPFDPSRSRVEVDATHIKLHENDLKCMIGGGKYFAAQILSCKSKAIRYATKDSKKKGLATITVNGVVLDCPYSSTVKVTTEGLSVTLPDGDSMNIPKQPSSHVVITEQGGIEINVKTDVQLDAIAQPAAVR